MINFFFTILTVVIFFLNVFSKKRDNFQLLHVIRIVELPINLLLGNKKPLFSVSIIGTKLYYDLRVRYYPLKHVPKFMFFDIALGQYMTCIKLEQLPIVIHLTAPSSSKITSLFASEARESTSHTAAAMMKRINKLLSTPLAVDNIKILRIDYSCLTI